MTSASFQSYLACFWHFCEISIFFVFHVTLSVLMLRKWNFTDILTYILPLLRFQGVQKCNIGRIWVKLNDKWVVKRPKFASYCTINCGEIGNNIFLEFLVFEWLISGRRRHIWSYGCIILTFLHNYSSTSTPTSYPYIYI